MKKFFKGIAKGAFYTVAGVAVVWLGIETHDKKDELKEAKVVKPVLDFVKKGVSTVKKAWSSAKTAADESTKEEA